MAPETEEPIELPKPTRIPNFGNWRWDKNSDTLSLTREVYDIFGTSPENFSHTFQSFLEIAHPDDRVLIDESINKAIKNDGVYDLEHRIIRPDGSERIICEYGKAEKDYQGNTIGLIGAIHDVTEQRTTERRLHLANQVIEKSDEGVMITNSEGNIESVNPAFTEITGYKKEEITGQNPRVLRSGRHDAKFYAELWRAINTAGYWRGEIWNKRKNGEVFCQLLSITAVKDGYGKTTHYIGVFYDLTEKKKSEEIQFQATRDSVTGLSGRNILVDRLTHAIGNAKRQGTVLAVFLIGLDGFKKINESLGHAKGDMLLKEAGTRINESARETDTVARFGGDEFALVLEDVKSAVNTVKVAEKLVKKFTEPFKADGEEIFISASLGVTLCPNDGDQAESIIQNADIAMHRAKDEGGNTYQLFTSEMNEKAVARLTLEREIRGGIDQKEFTVFYQPKVDLLTGQITGMESLVRWEHPQKRLLFPGAFIPVAEETGLIVQIGRYVLWESCRINKEWQNAGYPPVQVAVNLSARHFQEGDVVSEVKAVLKETGLAPEYLELEITESMVMKDVERAIETLKELSAMGIKLSVDDFGTGYSSFGYLKRFPIDALKIDIIFIKDMMDSKEDQEMVAAIISMAHNLNLKVIAEGVENAEQIKLLKDFNCDQIQGYFFSRPVDAKAFELLLKNKKVL